MTQKNSAKATLGLLVSERRKENKQNKEKLNSVLFVLRSEGFLNIANFFFFFLYDENILFWVPCFLAVRLWEVI